MNEPILCRKCMGRGFHEPKQSITSGIQGSICKGCGFEALGQTQIKQFEKRGGYCRTCTGDWDYR